MENNPHDAPNLGHAIIGFFFWPIGLLAYLLLFDTSPRRAKSIGTGVALGMFLTFLGAIWIPFAVVSGALHNIRATPSVSSSLDGSYRSSESEGTSVLSESVETPTPEIESYSSTSTPEQSNSTSDEESLRQRYNSWLQAWQSRDINRYLSFYSSGATVRDADGKPYGLNDLRTRRTKRWVNERDIKIEDLDLPSINIKGNEATLTAERNYSSNISNYSGVKTLTWEKINDEWVITKEDFKMSSSDDG